MCITYMTIIVWLIFLAFLVVPTFCWLMFSSICSNELADVWHGPGARRPGPDHRLAPSLSELKNRENFYDQTYSARLANYYHQNYHQNQARMGGFIPAQTDTNFHLKLGNAKPFNDDINMLRNRYSSSDFNYVFNLTHYGKIYFCFLVF